jgi:hypothetical protein
LSLKERVWTFHLAHLSKPAENRPIYQELLKGRTTKILEVGVGLGQRAAQIIQIASRLQVGTEINYTGIDLFEARDPSQGPGLALRQAHRLLAQTGARIRLAPGDAFTGVAQVANALAGTDLIVISGCQDRELVDRAWFYFPRMIHQHTAVFLQNPCQTGQSAPYERILPAEIEALAARKRHLRAA